jgi:hypothetical protein
MGNRLIVALTRQHVRTALIAEAARVSPSRIYQVVNSAPAGNEADLTAQRSEIDATGSSLNTFAAEALRSHQAVPFRFGDRGFRLTYAF